jgi:hypothetical protein
MSCKVLLAVRRRPITEELLKTRTLMSLNRFKKILKEFGKLGPERFSNLQRCLSWMRAQKMSLIKKKRTAI